MFFSFASIAYADVDSSEVVGIYSFARTYTVEDVTSTSQTIVTDNNWFNETSISCTWKSTSGPMSIRVICDIKYNGEWCYYSYGDLTAVTHTANFTINGGEPFRLRVLKLSGNDGDCTFGVTLV